MYKIFQQELNKADTKQCIENGFRKCGLFPLNPNNVDYTKCVKNKLERIHDDTEHAEKIICVETESAKKLLKF